MQAPRRRPRKAPLGGKREQRRRWPCRQAVHYMPRFTAICTNYRECRGAQSPTHGRRSRDISPHQLPQREFQLLTLKRAAVIVMRNERLDPGLGASWAAP